MVTRFMPSMTSTETNRQACLVCIWPGSGWSESLIGWLRDGLLCVATSGAHHLGSISSAWFAREDQGLHSMLAWMEGLCISPYNKSMWAAGLATRLTCTTDRAELDYTQAHGMLATNHPLMASYHKQTLSLQNKYASQQTMLTPGRI